MAIALVTAGGCGVRTGYAVPKQFLTVNEKPILIYTLENVQQVTSIEKIVVVIPEGWENFVRSYCSLYSIEKIVSLVQGGESRFTSIFNGIKEIGRIKTSEDDIVILCDGNRPLTPRYVFDQGIQKAKYHDGVLTVDASVDSLYECKNDVETDNLIVVNTAERNRIYKGQCPEFARYSLLEKLYQLAMQDGMEDLPMSALFLHYGKKVVTINGSSKNFKITSADDIELFRAFVSANMVEK